MSERPITQDDLIAALEEIELITGTGDGLDPDTTARVHMLAGIGRAVEDAAAWFAWPAAGPSADVHALVDRLRAAAGGLRSFYKPGAVELIPADTMDEAADTIAALTAERDALRLRIDEWREEVQSARSMRELYGRKNAELIAERDALMPWARLGAQMMGGWPDCGDLDGVQLHEMAKSAGVLTAVPGGFNPEEHDDETGAAEQGDPWFMSQRLPKALRPDTEGGA